MSKDEDYGYHDWLVDKGYIIHADKHHEEWVREHREDKAALEKEQLRLQGEIVGLERLVMNSRATLVNVEAALMRLEDKQ